MHNDTTPTADEVEALRIAAARPEATNQDYFAWTTARDEREAMLDAYYSDDEGVDLAEEDGYEPDLDFMFETDSALASCGWGTDEDYGYYGGEDY